MVMYQMITTIDIRLTLFAIIPLPIIAFGSLLLGKSIRKRFKKKQEVFAGLSDMVQESISGVRVIKAFVQEAKEIMAFNRKNKESYDKNIHVIRLQAIMMPLATAISGLSIAIALGYGGYLVMIDDISLGSFVAFIQYLMMMTWPMIAVGWCINIVSQGTASLERLRDIMNEQPDIVDEKDAIRQPIEIGAITINNLTYTYPGFEEPVLSDINMVIKPGETVGIIGKTGSGKTTLMNLLLRLYNPPKDSISVGGEDIYRWSIHDLRDAYGYVPQDNFLFSDTIFNNINFAKISDQVESVESAAKFANVHDNIVDFSHGYDTIVGERGVTLSGGQKQRISIARAYLKNPLFLIF
jgi:ATP-binding cassette subfamily B protein